MLRTLAAVAVLAVAVPAAANAEDRVHVYFNMNDPLNSQAEGELEFQPGSVLTIGSPSPDEFESQLFRFTLELGTYLGEFEGAHGFAVDLDGDGKDELVILEPVETTKATGNVGSGEYQLQIRLQQRDE